eukprot:jgi/Tetstr1/421125/TSEL_012168.t1
MCIEAEDMIGDTMHACIQICPHVAWHTVHKRCKDTQTVHAAMDPMELIGLPSREEKVQSRKGKAITKADLPALSGPEVQKMLEGRRQLMLDAVIPASHVDRIKILACMEQFNMEIKEGFRKGSNHQPQRLLKTGKGGQLICILVVYVDDMIFAFKDAVWAADFKTAFGARFDIKDLGVCARALGMAVERDWDNATLKVHQAKYIDDMLHKFNPAAPYAVSTPAEVGADIPGSNKPLAAEVMLALIRLSNSTSSLSRLHNLLGLILPSEEMGYYRHSEPYDRSAVYRYC